MSDCLNEAVTGLGQTPKIATKTTNPVICKNVAGTEGMCVDYNLVDNQILIAKSNNRQATTTIFSSMHGQMISSMNKLLTICKRANGKAVGDKLGNVTLTQQILDSCQIFVTNQNLLSSRSENINNSTYLNNCSAAIYRLINGSYCLLLSAKATNHAVYKDNTVTLYTKQETADFVFSRCAPLFLTSCYINQASFLGKSFTSKAINSAGFYETCRANLQSLESCNADATKCSNQVKAAVVNYFMTPKGAAFADRLETNLESDTASIPDNFGQRRLQSSAITFNMAVDDAMGYDISLANTGLPDTVTGGIPGGSSGSGNSTTSGAISILSFGAAFLAALLSLLW